MKRQNLRTVSLIVVTFTYLLIGAAIFGWLESEHEHKQRDLLDKIEGWLRVKYNISDDDFTVLSTTVIKSLPYKAGIQWKFPGALYFATTVVTTIGYGHSTPSTYGGRSFCMLYALIGIPLGLVMFQSIGERLNTFVGSALRHVKRCFRARNPEVTQTNLVMVVLVLSTILMTSMANVFAQYEKWEYFDAFYYCFITLTTIGFGDYVALQKESALQDKPEYVALSLIFILFGLSVVSSAVNLLVLKFLTLNTEDERRDEQLRYTAALNPIQLEGDVITSSAGQVEYARIKRPALTLSQAMASSALMSEQQRRALASAKLARSRPVLALKHSKLDMSQPATVMANHGRRMRSSGSSPRSTDSSSRRGTHPSVSMHVENARHRAEADEMRQVIGERPPCDEPNCDDAQESELRRRRQAALTISSGDDEEQPAQTNPWQMRHKNECQRARRAINDKNDEQKGEVDESDEEEEDDEDSDEHQYCSLHKQNENISNLSADDSCCRAHNRPPCHAHACRHHHNKNNMGASVRYPTFCSHDDDDESSPINCPRQQHIIYVPSSQSFTQVQQHHHHHHHHHQHHHRRPYYHTRGSIQSYCQTGRGGRSSQNQLIPLEQTTPLSTQLAAIRTNRRPQAQAQSLLPPDDDDADDEDHARPDVELLMSAQSLSKRTSPQVGQFGQVFTYPDQTPPSDSRTEPMNRQRRANQHDSCSVSTLQLEQRYPRHALAELVRQSCGPSCRNQAADGYKAHLEHDHTRPVRRKITASQLSANAAAAANQSSCSCSWASLSAAIAPELIVGAPPARHWGLPSSRQHPVPDYPFHPADARAQTSCHSTMGRGQSYECNRKRTAAAAERRRPQKSFFQSSPAVHEIDHHDEQRSYTDDEQATAAAVLVPKSFGQSSISASLQTSPAQPKSPTSTFDGGRPASRRDLSPPALMSTSNFTFTDSRPTGAESPATVSTRVRTRPRRRSNENEPHRHGQMPKLVCKCCCQHAECIEYALSSDATKQQEPDGTNVIPMQGNNNKSDITNANKDDERNDTTSARDKVEFQANEREKDCERNLSELAASVAGAVLSRAGDSLISDDETQGDGDQQDKMISGQPMAITSITAAGQVDQKQEDGTSKQ